MIITFDNEPWTVKLDYYRGNQALAIFLEHETLPPCHVTRNALPAETDCLPKLAADEVICAMYWLTRGAVHPLIEAGVLIPTGRFIREFDESYAVYRLNKEGL